MIILILELIAVSALAYMFKIAPTFEVAQRAEENMRGDEPK